MLRLSDLSADLLAVVMLVLFAMILLHIGTLVLACFRRQPVAMQLPLWASGLICLLLVIFLADGRSRMLYGLPLLQPTRTVLRLPLPVLAGYLLLVGILLAVFTRWQLRRLQKVITRGTVKDSLDNLPTGLCFCFPDGFVVLANRVMEDLSCSLTGMQLESGQKLWQAVCRDPLPQGLHRVTPGDEPAIEMGDGRIWTFTSREITVLGTPMTQLTAVDTTEIYLLNRQLQQDNQELARMNRRLRKYGKNIDALTRDRERLDTKVRIHRRFGQALLTTRHYLAAGEGEPEQILSLWRHNVEALRTGTVTREQSDPLKELVEAANSAGVLVELEGRMPRDEESRGLIAAAAVESLTNAIRHGGATELKIAIGYTAHMCIARFTNNGQCPRAPITEGGGLGSLRRRIEAAGGSMELRLEPALTLEIRILRKDGGEP